MQPLELDPAGPVPLVRQIVEALGARIDRGELAPGARLLSVRALAQACGVSTMTVVNAYQRLVADGRVQARRASGYYVAAPAPTAPLRRRPFVGQTAVDEQWMLRRVFEEGTDLLNAGAAWLPPDWLDGEGLRQAMATLARKRNATLPRYGTPNGYGPLRQQLATQLAQRAVVAAAHQIVLTHGASQALELAARCLLRPGDAVLVDDPGSTNLYAMLRGAGMRLVGVPRTHEGPDTAALRHLAQRHRARVLVLMTQLHNPTGSCCTPAVAYQVLRLAEELDLRIVELDAMAGLEPPGATLLASLDGLQRVAYVSTFSKTLSPSLRVGYVAASEELVEQLVLHKMRASLTSSELVERLLHTLLAEGRHRAQLQRLAERLREAQQRVGDALEAAGLTLFQRPPGGPFLWARLPGEGVDMRAVAQRAVAAGIVLAPGDLFSVGQQRSPWTRLNVAYADDPRLLDFLRDEVRRARALGAAPAPLAAAQPRR